MDNIRKIKDIDGDERQQLLMAAVLDAGLPEGTKVFFAGESNFVHVDNGHDADYRIIAVEHSTADELSALLRRYA